LTREAFLLQELAEIYLWRKGWKEVRSFVLCGQSPKYSCAIVDGYQAGGTRMEIQIQSLFHTKVLNKDPQITLLQHLIGLLMARAPH